jgi:hypothetical protein
MWISDRFMNNIYVRPGIAVLGRIIEKIVVKRVGEAGEAGGVKRKF